MLNFAIIIDFLISLEAMKREFTIWPYGSCYRHIELWIYVKTINSLSKTYLSSFSIAKYSLFHSKSGL